MSEQVKCGICDRVVEGEDCQLMTVIINEDGKETKICCTNQISKKISDIWRDGPKTESQSITRIIATTEESANRGG